MNNLGKAAAAVIVAAVFIVLIAGGFWLHFGASCDTVIRFTHSLKDLPTRCLHQALTGQ